MPVLIATPFATNGTKNDIPETTGTQPQNATMDEGFPAITQQPISTGGIPPERADFNGILYALSDNISHINKGLAYSFDTAFATKIGGYPMHAELVMADGTRVVSTIANNMNNPDVDLTGWRKGVPASNVIDESGKTQQEVNNQTIQNYSNLPVGLFSGQPAKFNGIQYLWDSTSTATPEDNLIIAVGGTSVGRWIIHAYDGCIYSSTVNDIQKAVDYCAKNRLKFVQSGDLTLNTDLYLNTFESNAENDYFQYDAQGHKLHFTSGGLHFRTSRFSACGLRVSTDDVNAKGAIIIKPFLRTNGGETGFAVRFSFFDCWSTASESNGWYISNSWIGQFFGCYARFCKNFGVYLDHLDNTNSTLPGSYFAISCNNLVWVGGEIQGNGKNDGSGGGVYHGRLIGGLWSAVAIESNYGDGVVLMGANNNIHFDHCYIEKNGSLSSNRDVKCPSVGGSGGAANRSRNITFTSTNHTPVSGQERSFELYDVINLKIDKPIFYGSASATYTQEPILVAESFNNSSSGVVVSPTLNYSGYTQNPLLNNCTKFGELRRIVSLTGFDFLNNIDTAKNFFVTAVKDHIGRWNKLSFKFITVPSTNLQPVRLSLSARGYPTVTQYALKEETFTPSGVSTIQVFTHETTAANKNNLNGGLGWIVSRLGTHAEDTSTVPIQCVGAEFEYYVGVV